MEAVLRSVSVRCWHTWHCYDASVAALTRHRILLPPHRTGQTTGTRTVESHGGGSATHHQNRMLRNRDMAALVLVLILSRMAWDDGNDSLSASADLAFFFPRDGIMVMNPMDVDGDGTNEALAVARAVTGGPGESFVLEIMDLKPLHSFGKSYLAPFRPQVLFASKEIRAGGGDDGDAVSAYPIQIVAGQVLIQPPKSRNGRDAAAAKAARAKATPSDADFNERTRHYFCGSDWHDASTKCKTPCPKGQANECPDDERCFADTPCDALGEKHGPEDTQVMFELTPGGGLPSLATLWTNGMVTLHSLTNEKSAAGSTGAGANKRKSSNLELREMWRRHLFPKHLDFDEALWEEINILFLDAYSSVEANAQHGVIVVSGSYYLDGDPESDRSTFTVAIDAFKGKALWEAHSDIDPEKDDKPLPLPAVRGSTSFARRRSNIARIVNRSGLGSASAAASALPNCMSLLKRNVKEVLPYSYWGPGDAGLAAIHLNQKKTPKDSKNHRASKPHEEKPAPSPSKTKWHHRLVHRHGSKNNVNSMNQPIQARPNALVVQTKGGIQIRSLKNGKALCHLSLLEKALYSDLNNDGVIDQVQILLHSKENDPMNKFVWNLVSKLHDEHQELKDKGANKKLLLESKPNLCHALALSGMPAKEEIFSAPICGTAHERAGISPMAGLDPVNPLTVESLNGRRNTRDIIVALNNGMVHRLHGTTGRKEWATSGRQQENFPTWEEGSNHRALLTRIQARHVAPPVRPLLLAGENSLAVLSAKSGAILASAVFPQISTAKPVLADVSGDGATDVIILTKDGVWGFQIAVHPGSPIALRIVVGLLLMGLMLAFIRNRYGRQDKRSTDE